ENGSGKTTLMKGILGLKPLQSGKITYPGVTPNKIGYLPQVIEIQKDFPASVMEVVLSGYVNQLNNRVFYPKSFKEKAIRNLKLLEIDHLVNTSFRNLSGGQRQRVLLARALCATETILFLDEPVASLDVNITKSLFELLGELNRKHGITIVMITHDVSDIIKYSTKVLRMNTEIDFYGSSDAYRHQFGGLD
ncbi:MAG: ATP-binding cassette domain-containing protein, partial [Erysipelothrix sp.]|nr:ATP-binding cassette domain-containing protein [Erysipelothrix sp.]